MFKKLRLLLFTVLFVYSLSFSVNLELSAEGIYLPETSEITDRLAVKLFHLSPNFDFMAEIAFYNDDKYTFYESDYYFDHYFLIENSYVTFRNYDGTIEFGGGIKDLKDEIDSPYSLFFSSERISSPYLEASYSGENMFYTTRWVQLVSESNKYFETAKSMNYKTYGLKFGDFRFGYQDALVYDRTFDFYYFLNPMPAYFSQEIRSSSNTMPWAEKDKNDNTLMGFFFDFDKPTYYIYSQILVDDLNTNRFFNPEGTQNPDKIALSGGVKLKTNVGNLGLHGALATQYTFQPGGGPSYTVYPENLYDTKVINYTENYIGYKYGENAASVLIDYEYNYKNWFNFYTSFETVFSGVKSPTQDTAPDKGTFFLDDDTLEKRFIYTIATDFYFKNFELNVSSDMGKIQNAIIYDPEQDKFIPSDEEKNIFTINFGLGIKF